MAREKWKMDIVRGDTVGEMERVSSHSEGMELKFNSKCYVKPLKDFKQKEKGKKKEMSFTWCPQCLAYNRRSEPGRMS